MEESKHFQTEESAIYYIHPTLKSPIVFDSGLLIDKGPTEQIIIWDLHKETACTKIIQRAFENSDAQIEKYSETEIMIASSNKIYSLNIQNQDRDQKFCLNEDDEKDEIIFFRVIDLDTLLFATLRNKVFRLILSTNKLDFIEIGVKISQFLSISQDRYIINTEDDLTYILDFKSQTFKQVEKLKGRISAMVKLTEKELAISHDVHKGIVVFNIQTLEITSRFCMEFDKNQIVFRCLIIRKEYIVAGYEGHQLFNWKIESHRKENEKPVYPKSFGNEYQKNNNMLLKTHQLILSVDLPNQQIRVWNLSGLNRDGKTSTHPVLEQSLICDIKAISQIVPFLHGPNLFDVQFACLLTRGEYRDNMYYFNQEIQKYDLTLGNQQTLAQIHASAYKVDQNSICLLSPDTLGYFLYDPLSPQTQYINHVIMHYPLQSKQVTLTDPIISQNIRFFFNCDKFVLSYPNGLIRVIDMKDASIKAEIKTTKNEEAPYITKIVDMDPKNSLVGFLNAENEIEIWNFAENQPKLSVSSQILGDIKDFKINGDNIFVQNIKDELILVRGTDITQKRRFLNQKIEKILVVDNYAFILSINGVLEMWDLVSGHFVQSKINVQDFHKFNNSFFITSHFYSAQLPFNQVFN